MITLEKDKNLTLENINKMIRGIFPYNAIYGMSLPEIGFKHFSLSGYITSNVNRSSIPDYTIDSFSSSGVKYYIIKAHTVGALMEAKMKKLNEIIKTEGIEKYIDKGYYNMYNLKNDDEYDNEYDDEYYDHICIIRYTMSYDK